MLVDQVIARLADRVPALSGRCQGAAELAALMRDDQLPNVTPFAFVVPLALDASPPTTSTGVHSQMLRETIAVIHIVDYAGDASGEAGLPDVTALRDDIINAIAGWQPDGAIDNFALGRARLLDLRQGTIFHQCDFTIQNLLRIFPNG